MYITSIIISIIILLTFILSEYLFFRWYVLKKAVDVNLWTKISILLTTVGTFIIATLYVNVIEVYHFEDIKYFNNIQSLIIGIYLTITFATSLVYVLYKSRFKIDITDDYITKYLGRNILSKVFSLFLIMAFFKNDIYVNVKKDSNIESLFFSNINAS